MRTLMMMVVLLGGFIGVHGQDHHDIDFLTTDALPEENDEPEPDLKKISVSLNSATADELMTLTFLSSLNVQAIQEYRATYGTIHSIYELMYIPGLDPAVIPLLVKCMTPGKAPSPSARQILKDGEFTWQHRMVRVYEKASPDHPLKAWSRLAWVSGTRIQCALTIEKDPGEPGWTRGPDYRSAFIFCRNLNPWIKQLVIGDFQVAFGQGATVWSAFSTRAAFHSLGGKKVASRLRPHTGSDENRFLRGTGATIHIGHWWFTPYISGHRVDGYLKDNGEPVIYQSGLHRTTTELSYHHGIIDRSMGGELSWSRRWLTVGYITSWQSFRDTANRKVAAPVTARSGIHYMVEYRRLSLHGEHTVQSAHGHAHLLGMRYKTEGLILCGRLETLNAFYNGLSANIFGTNPGEAGITSLYLSLNGKAGSKLQYDVFMHRKSAMITPEHLAFNFPEVEWGTRLTFATYELYSLYIALRIRTKETSVSLDDLRLEQVEISEQFTTRIHFQHHLTSTWQLRLRYDNLRQSSGRVLRQGHLVYMDLKWSTPRRHLSGYFRYAVFDAPGYDQRLYMYENDLKGLWTIPSYYGTGLRSYACIRYHRGRQADVSMKVARTVYRYRLNEGWQAKNEVKIQWIIRF